MNRKSTRLDYLSRIERVHRYIRDHLDDDMDLDQLADIACFSRCHWHRIYRGIVGETAAQTVRRLRLHRAAGELVNARSDIRNIARRAGYSSVEAFNRVFRAAYGEPPAQYRDRTQRPPDLKPDQLKETIMYETAIETLPPIRLAATRHLGDYLKIDEAFQRVFMWNARSAAVQGAPRMVGIFHDDPHTVETDRLQSDAGLVIESDMPVDGHEIRAIDVSGGRYAVLAFKGPYAELQRGYDWLFTTWLPESGQEAGEGPVYEEYLNDPTCTPPTELRTNICLPLAG